MTHGRETDRAGARGQRTGPVVKDETWGQIAWWVATILQWAVFVAIGLGILLLLAFVAGVHA